MIKKCSQKIYKSYRFSIAPMMDYTDTHYRVMMRQITKYALLYTEMIVAQALHHTKKINSLLSFNEIEHPIALQIGGDDPNLLAKATQIAQDWGYDEINLNVGCPSPRVKSGNFGACMMADPELVAKCIQRMKEVSDIPITIKHRIGIDHLDSQQLLLEFIDKIADAGANRFAIHARKAWLNGLSPKENRTVPPLEYYRVEEIKKKRPNLKIEINGGINTIEDCTLALEKFDGVMVGRAAYEHPLRWKNIDEIIYRSEPKEIKASEIIFNMIPYAEKHLEEEGRLWNISRHLVQIVENVPGARGWRREFTEKSQQKGATAKVLEKSARQLEDAGL
tara:strand:- start:178 stop:1182 length:1005 start_codon:yes stop_codon:yes gene_type:complete